MAKRWKARACAALPQKWAEALAAEYWGLGFDVEVGRMEPPSDGEAGPCLQVRITGLPQADLDHRLNDPLGEGRRAPRRSRGAEPQTEIQAGDRIEAEEGLGPGGARNPPDRARL